jgi:hypothetical protein
VTSASKLRRHWLERAYESAEIDASHWDPALGVEPNRRTIGRVYDYYGRLYERQARLQWAGLAKLIGPSFYAGFLDLGFFPDTTRRVLASLYRLIGAGRGWTPPADALRFFEVTFLTMQRKIFEDQALMHEAYLDRGLDAVHELRAAGIVDEATARAWEQIDSGDPERVQEGNRTLLFREQHDIIERYYAKMRGYEPPQGLAFTYLLTLAGSPAVPGASSYASVFPFMLPPSGGAVVLATPFPAGNIAVFANRWDLIVEDTWPAFRKLLDDPTGTVALVARPIEERVPRFRLIRRLGAILAALFRWRIWLRRERVLRRLGVKGTAISHEVAIDLTLPPRGDTRTWASTATPFPLKVLLPHGRTYTTQARLVVLTSSATGGDPDRLLVKLPSTDLGGARRTLDELARTWHASSGEIAAWGAAAEEASPDAYAYATHVFPAHPIDFVRLELQVEHHVEEDDYVVDVLFSWGQAATLPADR